MYVTCTLLLKGVLMKRKVKKLVVTYSLTVVFIAVCSVGLFNLDKGKVRKVPVALNVNLTINGDSILVKNCDSFDYLDVNLFVNEGLKVSEMDLKAGEVQSFSIKDCKNIKSDIPSSSQIGKVILSCKLATGSRGFCQKEI